MKQSDTLFLQTLGRFIQDKIDAGIKTATAPLLEQISRLEGEAKVLRDTVSVFQLTEDEVKKISVAVVTEHISRDRDAGLLCERGEVLTLIDETTAKRIKEHWENEVRPLIPQKRSDEELDVIVRGAVLAYFEKFPVQNGKDVDMEVVRNMIFSHVNALMEDWPKPRDGKDVNMAEVSDMIVDTVCKYMESNPPKAGEPGKDGANITDMLINRDGELVITLSNGVTKNVGRVVGEDGKPGEPGKNGLDGVGFDDFTVEHDGERNLTMVIAKGENVKRFPVVLSHPLDRGVWKAGEYERGDTVTWGGSQFIAQRKTSAKPETSADWRLAVKRGRDGAPGAPGKEGKPGQPGRDGRDLTQLGQDGKKWG